MIFTFYSFKGGVGRSMMLANAGELFCQRGLKVLLIDFDLEAPGLERFFSRTVNSTDLAAGRNDIPLPDHVELAKSRGVVDLFTSYKTLQALPPPAAANPPVSSADGGQPQSQPPASFPYHVEPLHNFIKPIRTESGTGGSLWLMPAGRRDDDEYSLYAERVRAFDWDEFYARYHGKQFFDWFGEQLRRDYDVVLIDSRTGITEMGGVCTHELADSVVLFAAANEQNLEGTQRIARSLSRRELVAKRGGRELSIIVVPSRVELAEGQKLKEFSDKFGVLADMIDKRIKFRTSAFLDLRVPYVPYYAFGENVAVREPGLPIAADMTAAATRICSAMMELVPKDSLAYSRYQAAQANLPRLTETAFAAPPADFAGRDWVFQAIEGWLNKPAPPALPTMLIVGAPGSGKTALAARMVAAADDRTALGGKLRLAEQLVLAHACRTDEGWRPFLEKLVRALAARWSVYVAAVVRAAASIPGIAVRTQQRISSASDQPTTSALSLDSITIGEGVSHETAFAALVRQPLADANLSGTGVKTALVLVDGLDEVLSSDKETVADLLAAAVRSGWPSGLKLLMLSRPDPRILRMSPNVIALDGDADLFRPDIVAYADLRLGRQLGPKELELVAEQVATAANGNFLYAGSVLDAVLENARDPSAVLANLDEVLKPGHIPEGLHRRFTAMIQEEVGLDTERWSQRYRPILGVLAVSPGGFTADELAGITERPRSEISDSLRLMQNLVVETPDTLQVRLFHPSFATFLLTNTEYGVSAVEAHEAVAGYFIGQYAGRWTEAPDLAVQDVDRFLVAAINETKDRRKGHQLADQLAGLLLEGTFVAAKLVRRKNDDLRLGVATVLLAATDHPRRNELMRLDLLVRERHVDLLASLQANPKSLPNLLSPLPDIIPPDGPPSDPTVLSPTPTPTPAPPTPEDLITNETLRKQIPTSVQIDLTLARRASFMGMMVLYAGLCLTGTLFMGRILHINYSDLLMGVYAFTLISVGYLVWVARVHRGAGTMDDGPRKYKPGDWEKLPEIISLRAKRRPYQLLGDVSVASPYFEITLLILIVGVVAGTVSYPIDLAQYFARAPASAPMPWPAPVQVAPSKVP